MGSSSPSNSLKKSSIKQITFKKSAIKTKGKTKITIKKTSGHKEKSTKDIQLKNRSNI
jgi:hypothetical protein